MEDVKIVLIGAGSAQFGLGTVADILTSDILKGSTISLLDINKETLDIVSKICRYAIEDLNLDFKLESTTNREDALSDADFIICSIETGDRFKLWEQDYNIPRKYGSKQVFGENGGPGGLFHSLRQIKSMIPICEDIVKICPNAFLINFSNPMSRICLAIKRKFPILRFVGLCHEIHFLEMHLQRMLNVPFSDLEIKAGGLNHFGILLEVFYRSTGEDAYPDIRKKALDYLKDKREVGLIREIVRIYNYLPYTTDSHFGEYIHWAWEVYNEADVRNFYETYKASCIAETEKLLKLATKRRKSKRWIRKSGERAIPIIEGILTDSGHTELSVNLPNENNLIENLPRDLVIEGPAIVNKNGVNGIKLGEIPDGLAALMNIQATVQDLTVKAALNSDKKIALQALLADPVVESLTQAEQILEELSELQREYLPF
ncbi:MAG: family 4 glycosyl hydrolase [Candidatus Helarchaeota archaeon]